MGFMLGSGLQGKRLGIVGLGGIGRKVAQRARAFGMEIAYHSRHPAPAEVEAALGARAAAAGASCWPTADVRQPALPADRRRRAT